MLEVTSLYKSYRNHKVLSGVSLTASPGECVGIIGSNGCGKTTLLSILAGAVRADKGSIRFAAGRLWGMQRFFMRRLPMYPRKIR